MNKKSTDYIDSSEDINSKTSDIMPTPDDHTGELVVSKNKVVFNGEEYSGNKSVYDIDEDEVTSLTIKEDYTTHIGRFNDFINLRSVTLEGIFNDEQNVFKGCTSFTEFIVPETNPYYCTIDGLLIQKKGMVLKSIPNGRGPHVNIPEGVRDIGYFTLGNCPNLISVELPSTITYMEFLEHGKSTDLKSFFVAEGNPSYMAEDGVLFTKNKGILVALPVGKGTEYTIPVGVAYIGENVFSGCSLLRSLTIPSSVVRIEMDTFYDCISLEELHVQAEICPAFHSQDTSFSNHNKENCTLYVPSGTKKLYEENGKWGVFRKIKEEQIPIQPK